MDEIKTNFEKSKLFQTSALTPSRVKRFDSCRGLKKLRVVVWWIEDKQKITGIDQLKLTQNMHLKVSFLKGFGFPKKGWTSGFIS